MDSDVLFQQEKLAYEAAAKALVGQKIISIHYYQLKSEGDPPNWDFASSQFHVLDFGVEFKLASGELFSLIWGNKFSTSYSLTIRNEPLSSQLTNSDVWDVSHDPAWSSLTNLQIQNVNVHWSWWATSKDAEVRHHYPQDLEIIFDGNDSIFIGVYVYLSDGRLVAHGDEIIVFFNQDIARTYLIGPYCPDESTP